MLARNYYTFVTALPNISLEDHKLPFNVALFKDMLKEAMLPSDFNAVSFLYYSYDNQNLLKILNNKKEEDFDKRGLFTEKELNTEIVYPIKLPQYMQSFLNIFCQPKKNMSEAEWSRLLTDLYYEEALKIKNSFLRDWFEFELNIKNVWTGLSCRKHNVSLEGQLIGSNEIVEIIKKSHSKDFGLSKVFPYAEEVFIIYETSDLLQREKKMDMLKWQWIEDHMTFHYFSIEVIIGFLLRLKMVERWLKLEYQTGKERLESLASNICSQVE